MNQNRFIIGIDLGTTNIAVAFCDTAADPGRIELFPVPQLVAPGEVRAERLYPSSCWLPDREFDAALLALPWKSEPGPATGLLARNEGALQPSRYIFSAKSWLCHAGIDRRKKILPWHEGGGNGVMSPLEVTALYLHHLRQAWNHRFASLRDHDGEPCVLEKQQVVITIPASFDETARELTLAAAVAAGFGPVSLQEEPLAAFYAWLHRHHDDWQRQLEPGHHILVVDIGGGTTDFSLIGYGNDGMLSRTAAGDHLLLGGDNIDIALARRLEARWRTHLPQEQWLALCAQTRAAKERLLSDVNAAAAPVTLLSRGSSVIGGARSAEISRDDLRELLEQGFFPELPADAPPPRRQSGIRSMGLPYAADPAITSHLLDFLRRANPASSHRTPLRPDRILFNGGSLLPDLLRRRLTRIVSGWFPDAGEIPELDARDPELAVAIGAAAAALAGRGIGPRVKCGTARSYYIETAGPDGRSAAVCVMPHGVDENVTIDCGRRFRLEANRSAGFPLYSSAVRTTDRPGALVELNDDLTAVSRLTGILRFGNREHRRLDTTIAARLTETGVLQLEIHAPETGHRWPLRFDTRFRGEKSPAEHDPATPDTPQVVVTRDLLEQAETAIRAAFDDPARLAALPATLEEILTLPRSDWPLPLLRQLADRFLAVPPEQLSRPEADARFLNLTGYCLRPGFGDPADETRLRRLWKEWNAGPRHPGNPQNAAEYWVFWRRLAPGLSAGQQRTVFQHLAALLAPKGTYQTVGSVQERAEMWRCLGAQELLPPDQKIRLGKALLARGAKLTDAELWTLGRLGSRRLFHAPGNLVVPSAQAGEWASRLMKLPKPGKFHLLALYLLAAASGDRVLDLPPPGRKEAAAFLQRHQAPQRWLDGLEHPEAETDARDRAQILGDTLPLGLSLIG